MNSSRIIRTLLILAGLIGAGWVGYTQLRGVPSDASEPPTTQPISDWPGNDPSVAFSAPGVTEPASRTIQLFSEMPGTIRHNHVTSGDRVKAGQVLIELANDTQKAEVSHREALVASAKANLAKLESWERTEDRLIAKAQWNEAEAMVRLAEFEVKRVTSLAAQNVASDKEISSTRDNLSAARSRAVAAKALYDRSQAGPRPEDLAVARAVVAEAEAGLAIASTYLEKTYIRSPIDGVVIYRFREPGETVFPEVPAPILSLGNCDTLHLRADVDEMDLSRVSVGQRVFAMADAFGQKRFGGKVVHVEKTLGRKNFRTNRPSEKADTKILEVVIALDDAADLPVDLQMTVWFLGTE